MLYRINEIKLKPGESKANIKKHIIKKLGKNGKNITIDYYRIVKESIDARDKKNIMLSYSIDFSILPREKILNLPIAEKKEYVYPENEEGSLPLKCRPVVCGFGPAGIFAALILARKGYKPIVLERGSAIEKRVKDVEEFWTKKILNEESNVQFGEGGAGTFSDGKLTTNIKDKRISFVLDELVKAGADSSITYKQKPHIGTDILRNVVVNLRQEIQNLGGTILFDTRLEEINIKSGRLKSIKVKCTDCSNQKLNEKDNEIDIIEIKDKSDGITAEIETETMILAIGHSARDTMWEIYSKGIDVVQKPFSIGFRIEHRQNLIDIAQYGKPGKELGLPPAEYKLSHKCRNGRGVYTFCMCPGGEIVMSASEKNTIVTNGMSYSERAGEYANSAVLTDVRTSDFENEHALAGLKFQEKYERLAFELAGKNYDPPECSFGDFKSKNEKAMPLINSLPDFAVEAVSEAIPAFGRKLKGFDDDDVRLVGVETRSSSPIRIPRNENYVSNIEGIYPSGEGAGYAGGIMSAAVDGIRCAEAIIRKYSAKE